MGIVSGIKNLFFTRSAEQTVAVEPLSVGRKTKRRGDSSPRHDRYDKMRSDAQISLGLATIKAPIFGAAWEIKCADAAIQEWTTAEIARNWRRVARKQLKGCEFGAADGEKVFKLGADRKYHLDSLDDFEPNNVRYFKDDQGQLIGISYSGQGQLGRDKFMHLALDEEYGDPHGRSKLIPVEKHWRRGEHLYDLLEQYIERKIVGTLVGYAPNEKQRTPDGVEFNPIDTLHDIMKLVRSGSDVSLPDLRDAKGNLRYSLSYLQDDKRVMDILSAINEANTMKLRGLLVPERTITQDAGTGAYSMADAHTETFLRSEEDLLADFADMMQELIDQLVTANWGANAPRAILTTKPLSKDVENLIRAIFVGLANSSPDVFVRILDLVRLCDMHDIPLTDTAADKLAEIQARPFAAPGTVPPATNLRRSDGAGANLSAKQQLADTDKIFNSSRAEAIAFFEKLKTALVERVGQDGGAPSRPFEVSPEQIAEYANLLGGAMLEADLAARVRVVKTLPADVELRRSTSHQSPVTSDAVNLAAARDDIKLFDVDGVSGVGSFSTDFAKQAAQFLTEKSVMTPEAFAQLAEGYKQRAFTMSGDFSQELMTVVKDKLAEVAAKGGTAMDFRKAAGSVFDELGVTEISPARLDTIFNTNVQAAYGAGQKAELTTPGVAEAFPFYQVSATMWHTRPSHAELNGRVFRSDDPLWRELWTPFDYNCHCSIIPIARSQAEAQGIAETQPVGWRPEQLLNERREHGFV